MEEFYCFNHQWYEKGCSVSVENVRMELGAHFSEPMKLCESDDFKKNVLFIIIKLFLAPEKQISRIVQTIFLSMEYIGCVISAENTLCLLTIIVNELYKYSPQQQKTIIQFKSIIYV